MKNLSILIILLTFCLYSCQNSTKQKEKEITQVQFEENWESLAKINREPEWYKDAKFGIYFHWGVYSVPAYKTEWYPHRMYISANEGKEGTVFNYHKKTYGGVDKFNYHDFIPMFTGEHFDAAKWADLFKETGARFAGPVAQHHDGFAMWDSEVNPWNSKEKGPKKDILGDLFKELKKRDMNTIATFHHARHLQRHVTDTAVWAHKGGKVGWGSHFPYSPEYITSTTDPELSIFYGNMPKDKFHDFWLNQVNEVVDKYAPDIIWFDSWLDSIPENYRKRMVAHMYNTATSRGQEPIVAYKQEDLPDNVGILDIEQGGKTGLSDDYWLTDITISYSSWCYTNGQTYKDPALVIRNMIDVWSKKGIVLLNISPKANGIIPDEQREVLKIIGNWINKHEEAVYDTRTFNTFGYGVAEFEKGHFGGQSATMKYTKNDIRFMTSTDKKQLYVYILGLPDENTELEINAPISSKVKNVSVVGSDVDLQWLQTGEKLTITTPQKTAMDEIATVFKVELN
ncbi:alpha-L-fucosidase [uncultured Draconibacterium sp.]|uniref:alpha-L-fucosidase n=1 Tax=uncultured Draconibacterium sp. TaxID=1573823 RepID=UPI003260F7C6